MRHLYENAQLWKDYSHYDAELVWNAYVWIATIKKIIKGFETAGIAPVIPSGFDDDNFLPADLFAPTANPINQNNYSGNNTLVRHRGVNPKPLAWISWEKASNSDIWNTTSRTEGALTIVHNPLRTQKTGFWWRHSMSFHWICLEIVT